MTSNKGIDSETALEAKSKAQWIAFAPFVFQATVTIRDCGLLAAIDAGRNEGADLDELVRKTGISLYGVRVLLDFALDIGLVVRAGSFYTLGKVGYFVLNDDMTRVNMNFTRDVCYRALESLEESVRNGVPAGLTALGEWKNLYDGLTRLPEPASDSWFRFDHFYSDRVFDEFLPVVFGSPVTEILDIGGNTGRWAERCLTYDSRVHVTIMDLPRQVEAARENIQAAGYGNRFNGYPLDVLRDSGAYYQGADVIWMCQFLDCFSESEILRILEKVVVVMDANTVLYIVELFWDRQKYDAARFSLNAVSLYFTCIANGKSRMYHSDDMKRLVEQSGLKIIQERDDIGEGHTVLCCRRQ